MHLLFLTILACVRFAFYVRFSIPNFSGRLFCVSCDFCSRRLQKSQLTQKFYMQSNLFGLHIRVFSISSCGSCSCSLEGIGTVTFFRSFCLVNSYTLE